MLERVFPLSLQQRRVWRQQRGGEAFRCQIALEVEEAPASGPLHAALDRVVDVYDVLRTTFREHPGRDLAEQVVGEGRQPLFTEVDLTAMPAGEREAGLAAALAAQRRAPFDLGRGPLLRACRIGLAPDRQVLALCAPSLVCDAAGLEALLDAWGKACSGSWGEDPVLQYADLAEWQREILSDEEGAVGRRYWRDRLNGMSLDLELPFQRRPVSPEPVGPERIAWELDAALTARIDAAAARLGAAREAFLLAGWVVLLHRLTGREDLVVGVAADGRGYEDLREAPGLFARWLPLRWRAEPGAAFSGVLRALSRAREEGESWQEYFAWEEDREGLPFVAAFDLQPAGGAARFAGRPARRHSRHSRVESAALLLTGAGAALELRYDPESLAPEAVDAFRRSFCTLLDSAAREPEEAIGRLELLDEEDRRRLWVDLNATGAAIPPDPVHRLFAAQAARTPDRVAVVCGEERLTYAELDHLSSRLARVLRGRGIGPETPVGLYLDRSAGLVASFLAVLKAGGFYVPLELDTPAARLRGPLKEMGVGLIVTRDRWSARLAELDVEVLCLDLDAALFEAEPPVAPAVEVEPEGLVYAIFTSGSTGSPKGVGVSHRGLVSYTEFIITRLGLRELPSGLRFAAVSTFAADLAHTVIFPSLLSGGTLHIVDYDRATDARLFAGYLAASSIDVVKSVPSHLRSLLAAEGAPVLPARVLILGGEELDGELAGRVRAAAPGLRLINHYGPTETTVGSLTFEVEGAGEVPVPIGRPIANARIYLLDHESRLVAPGVPGELYIGGAGVARGYLSHPELTAEKFLPDPFGPEPGARLYRTGDLACYLPGGDVRFLGRMDDQFKIRGHRVEPGEVQAALACYPAVSAAAVVVWERAPGRRQLAAYFVAAGGEAPTAEDLARHLGARLPEHMVPASFTRLDKLPLTPNGKLDRRALPRPAVAEAGYQPPRDSVESALAAVWSQVLGVERIGIHDDFFELGGDSILSIQIVARARREGLWITSRQLFEHSTIAALALVAAKGRDAPADQGEIVGEVPLTPVQRRFFEQDLPRPGHYNMSLLLAVRRPLAPGLFQKAVARLLRHHDALRLRFERTSGGWRQRIAAAGEEVPAATICLAALPEPRRREALEAAAAVLQGSLDLTSGPIVRATLFDVGADRPGRLLLIVHHLAMDVVSWRILIEDLQDAYLRLEAGTVCELPLKTTSFKSWAERLAEHARSPASMEELDGWLAMESAPPLPADGSGGPDAEGAARTVTLNLDEGETRALLDSAATRGVPVQETLLAAVAWALARWTGGPLLSVELEGHGREDLFQGLDLSRTVGWFTSHCPLTLRLARTAAPAQALRAVREGLRRLPRRGIGYGLLRYSGETGSAAALAELPSPEVSFNYLGQNDLGLPESDLFASAPEFPGPERYPGAPRRSRLAVHGGVSDGRLQVFFTYGERVFRRETIKALTEDVRRALRQLVSEPGGEDRTVAEDVLDIGLRNDELDAILRQIGQGA